MYENIQLIGVVQDKSLRSKGEAGMTSEVAAVTKAGCVTNAVSVTCVCVSLSPLSSEDWSEELSSGEESLSSSLGSDAGGPYFPAHFQKK